MFLEHVNPPHILTLCTILKNKKTKFLAHTNSSITISCCLLISSLLPLFLLIQLLLSFGRSRSTFNLLLLLAREGVGSLGTASFLLLFILLLGGSKGLLLERGNDLSLVLTQLGLAVGYALCEALCHGGRALQRGRVAVQVDERHAGDLAHSVPAGQTCHANPYLCFIMEATTRGCNGCVQQALSVTQARKSITSTSRNANVELLITKNKKFY